MIFEGEINTFGVYFLCAIQTTLHLYFGVTLILNYFSHSNNTPPIIWLKAIFQFKVLEGLAVL